MSDWLTQTLKSDATELAHPSLLLLHRPVQTTGIRCLTVSATEAIHYLHGGHHSLHSSETAHDLRQFSQVSHYQATHPLKLHLTTYELWFGQEQKGILP